MDPNETRPVSFTAKLKEGVDYVVAKEQLSALADDLSIDSSISSLSCTFLHVQTTRTTYERVFRAELFYTDQWREKHTPKIPDALKDTIERVLLDVDYPIWTEYF